ncbi:MAG: EF-P lysine aminoacylase GenX [Gammaproteobacteria bacterium]|nr:EF-P lysine aminoacylase GenX [Gammaproteobacteria bacterium]
MTDSSWAPTATVAMLRRRAAHLATIRQFFFARDVLEVETPALAAAGVTAPHIESLQEASTGFWLQSSPEYAMKRLLAAGVGDCYHLARAFRAEEQGRYHNPEFTLLEWYRVGWDAAALMAEIEALVAEVLGDAPVHSKRYAEAFLAAGLPDPLSASDIEFEQAAIAAVGALPVGLDRDAYLDLLLDAVVIPSLPTRCFLTHYPASQAALAQLDPNDPQVAQRFEFFCDGVELANGFVELTAADVQQQRFLKDQRQRQTLGRRAMAMDERLLAALKTGLPACAGVALGVDRLIMLAEGADSISDVMAFSWKRA